MKILLVMEKWCDLNKSLGVTSANSNLLGSLKCANIPTEVLYYDEYLDIHKKPIEINPDGFDLMILSYYPHQDPRNIPLPDIKKIRDKIPVVCVWFDYVHPHIQKLVETVSDSISLNVVVDTFVEKEKFLSLWVPQDETIFYPGNIKNHNVCFAGTTQHYPERIQYLKNLNIHVTGGQRERNLEISDYAETLRQSFISLNFPSKPDGSIQAKSRIYETMLCKALLLEKNNQAINRWFDPMVHYVPFSNPTEMKELIDYYLKNTTERDKIIESAYQKMTTDYTSSNWWSKVIKELD